MTRETPVGPFAYPLAARLPERRPEPVRLREWERPVGRARTEVAGVAAISVVVGPAQSPGTFVDVGFRSQARNREQGHEDEG
jgi:hypothetical protein